MDIEDTTEGFVYDDHTVFIYLGYGFERRIYLYVWEIIVILTCLVNCLVIAVLVRGKNRNVTNMILVAIAVSDSMTGLVTLPSYIMVYQTFVPVDDNGFGDEMYSLTTTTTPGYNVTEVNMSHNENVTQYFESHDGEQLVQEFYNLDEDLCRAFMISKFFISKMFHTISIWLTLFLCLQRYISVAFPFKAQTWFSMKNTFIICVSIAASSPLLHIYHLMNEKAKHGWCQWDVGDAGGQAYLWITFFLMHFLPSVSLIVLTILFISKLWKGSSKVERMSKCTNKSSQKRTDDNRRISIVVTAVVIAFLIPETPYGIFLLYSAIMTQTKKDLLPLETNRRIHAAYEILIVLSFHANFYIYTLLNRRFRLTLMRTFVVPIQRLFRKKIRHATEKTVSNDYTRNQTSSNKDSKFTPTEMVVFNSASSEKSSFANANSVCEQEHERLPLNAVSEHEQETKVFVTQSMSEIETRTLNAVPEQVCESKI